MVIKLNTLYRFDGFEVDPVNRVFKGAGQTIFLHARTFDLLLFMVRNPDRLLAKEELMNAVWGDTAVEEGNLTQGIFLLRKALATGAEGGKVIVTVPGRGYRFTAPIEEITSRGGTKADEDVAAETRAETPAGRRPLYWWIGGSLAAVLLVATGWLWLNRSVPGDHHGVVLADFENSTGDAGFDKALNIALAIDLKQSPWLDVASDAKTHTTLTLMKRKADERLTPALAREVCQRMNDQAVLDGLVARFGRKYLVTLTASDCIGGQNLVQTKAEADSRDEVPRAVDSVAAQMRRRLGEPLKSLQRFNKPLLAKATGSLDALKAYSVAHELGIAGRFQESVPLFQRAIELDPRFAIAYGDLSTVYGNLGEPDLSADASRKAYELRDSADERDRLYIIAAYHTHVTGDLHATIRDDEAWTEMYPRDVAPLTNLSNLQTQIGQPELGIDPAKRALALDRKSAVAWIVLARAQLYAGRVDDAIATCTQAIAEKMDGPDIHGQLVFAGFARQDWAMVDAQSQWAKGTAAEPLITLDQMLVAVARGQPRHGAELLDRVIETYQQRGLPERAARMRGGLPRLEAELGMKDAARNILNKLPPIDGSIDVPVAWAEVGETARAEAILQHDMKEFPEDTIWQYVNLPQIRAAIALSRNDPSAAIEALRPGVPYDQRSEELPAMRGLAYLALKRFDQAEAEFRKITAHPTAGVASADVALAHLGIARARALKGDTAGSRAEYGNFFALWKDAEPDVPVLREARSEYIRLVGAQRN
jgi:DNA-binding winged helix-turn-helix (wHTH) protein/tetratricopeptide (TPR) repeat protein